MAQDHFDRLSAVDAAFLHQEGPTSHMHIGAVMLFEGPPPDFDEFLDQIRGRLHLVPRYRQKLAFPRLEAGRPVWIDDPNFNLEYHVRYTALPSPGSEEQLRRKAARIVSQQLDRAKPLWELWLVEGLEGNRFALISKTHHCVVDGVSGVDLATVLFDVAPEPRAPEPGLSEWVPRPEPSQAELVTAGIRDVVRAPLQLASRALHAISSPGDAVGEVREAVEGLGEFAWAAMNPAPDTILNVDIGPHRSFEWVRCNLDDFKLVKNAFGSTVNDVVLAVVAGGLQRFFKQRGVRTAGLELRALVPVSIRADTERHQLGNRLAAMRAPLPVYVKDPVQRLRVVKEAMDGLKESKQAVGAEVLAGVQNFAPPTVLAQASRINFSTRLFNLLVTNVPGPQLPLYVLGRQALDIFPVAFLPQHHALAVAIMSYNGGIDFGLLGDHDVLPDLDQIAAAFEDSLAELVRAAHRAQPSQPAKRARRPPAKPATPTTAKTNGKPAARPRGGRRPRAPQS